MSKRPHLANSNPAMLVCYDEKRILSSSRKILGDLWAGVRQVHLVSLMLRPRERLWANRWQSGWELGLQKMAELAPSAGRLGWWVG